MFTVNLEKKMIAGKQLTAQEDLALKEANAILQKATETDISILERLGMSANIELAKQITVKSDKLSKYDHTRVFHIKEIEKICKQYCLRFLPTHYYKGTIDPLLPVKIKEFQDKHDVLLKSGRYREDTSFICAPKNSFALEARPKDPLLFYKINDEYYYLVHKWGNDLSITRRILGFFSHGNTYFVIACIIFTISCILLYRFLPQADVPTIVIGSIAVTIMSMLAIFSKVDVNNIEKWNSPFKD